MSVTLPDPAARFLNLPPPLVGPSRSAGPLQIKEITAHEGTSIRRRRSKSFTVSTAHGLGSYRSYSNAHAAAHWVADETGETVSVVNERTGQIWQIRKGLTATC
jgi:hypothetical protein